MDHEWPSEHQADPEPIELGCIPGVHFSSLDRIHVLQHKPEFEVSFFSPVKFFSGIGMTCNQWPLLDVSRHYLPVQLSAESLPTGLLPSTYHSPTYSYRTPVGILESNRSPVGIQESNRSPVGLLLDSHWISAISQKTIEFLLTKIQEVKCKLSN
jgi:hypothetical protein